MTTKQECLFFGYRANNGHVLQVDGSCYIGNHPMFGRGATLDGQYAPRRHESGRIVFMASYLEERARWLAEYKSSKCAEGEYLLHVHPEMQRPCWTMMSWWDTCQGDRRPGGNSTILLEGEHTAEEMIQALRDNFPLVLANLERSGVQLIPVRP